MAKDEVKYLGCFMNNRASPNKEIAKRIAEVTITFNRLHTHFHNADNTVKQKSLYIMLLLEVN